MVCTYSLVLWADGLPFVEDDVGAFFGRKKVINTAATNRYYVRT